MTKGSLDGKPIRIQRSRAKGWKMPPNTVYVGRPTRWGNPYYVGEPSPKPGKGLLHACTTAKEAVRKYAEMLFPYRHRGPNNSLNQFYASQANIEDIEAELCGKNLCCWCPLDQPCHADVLLEVANG